MFGVCKAGFGLWAFGYPHLWPQEIATGTYSAGDRVVFERATYEAVQSHTGNGDPNWIHALSLWKPVS